jgi:putative endopeptidase
MAGAVEKLFDGEEYMGGHVSGKLTLSENLADLGGLAIALTALKKQLEGTKMEEMKKAYMEFFTSYAVSWRQIDRPEKARQALELDVHAPPPLRVNLIVRQFQEFYDAFDITADAVGYIPVEKRIVFW